MFSEPDLVDGHFAAKVAWHPYLSARRPYLTNMLAGPVSDTQRAPHSQRNDFGREPATRLVLRVRSSNHLLARPLNRARYGALFMKMNRGI
jgi:hypothetical protein